MTTRNIAVFTAVCVCVCVCLYLLFPERRGCFWAAREEDQRQGSDERQDEHGNHS